MKYFADGLAFSLLQFAEQMDNKAAAENLKEFQRQEDTMEGEYEFCQRDLPQNHFPRGEHRASQERPGIYSKFHTKVYLGDAFDKDNYKIASNTSFTKLGSRARCLWCSRVNRVDHRTKICCVDCRVGFCPLSIGCSCWLLHVRNNGPPATKRVNKRLRK